MADNFKPVQAQKFTLSGGGCTSTATSITLNDFTLPDGTTAITTSNFGAIGFGTLEPGTSKEEQISFTTVTNNGDGTYTLSGVTRGLRFVSPYDEVTANKFAHAGGAIFVLSNTAGFYDKVAIKANDETITGTFSFTTVPNSSATPTSGNDLTNKTYVDGIVNGGTVSYDQIIVAGPAGETVSAGQLLYFDLTDNEWKKCDADTAASVNVTMLGIAQGAGTDGVAISGGVLVRGLDTNQSGMTQGDLMYASNTAGGISSSTGTTERVIGIAKSTTNLYFDPYFYYSPTATQKAAFASTTTPASTNLFTTQKDFQKNSEVYAVDSVGTDDYAITLSPAIAAYTAGMRFYFKAGTANTGAATLAVSGLTAKAIVKDFNVALATGDILANQIVEVVYDGVSDNFQLVSPIASRLSKVASGATTYDLSTASGSQTIAHGLGVNPRLVRVSVKFSDQVSAQNSASYGFADAVYSSSTQSASHIGMTTGGTSANTSKSGSEFRIYTSAVNGYYQTGTITTDATNITIAWTKTSTPTGTAYITWDAMA